VSRRASDLATNRALWALVNAEFTDARARRAWDAPEITWGLFEVPERELAVLGDVEGLDVADLGCGTAYFSAWLARRGARVVALDATREQLETARRCADDSGLRFPLIEADGAKVPLRGEAFDLVVSEYGASVWCDPDLWVAEAARLLRPGGRLVFLTNSVLATLCVPDEAGPAQERLLRPQRDLLRTQWPGGGIEFHPGHGVWIRILRAHGFEIEALHELHAPADAQTHEYYDIASAAWAARWPAEDLWSARRVR